MSRDLQGSTARLKRRWLYLPFIIAAVIVAAYGLLWRAGANEMKKYVATWVDEQRAAGFQVEHGEVRTDGFPFVLRALIDDASIAAPGQWRWRTDQLAIDALPYDLNRLVFSPSGEQRISVENAGAWRIEADDFRTSIASNKTSGWMFSATVGNAAIEPLANGASAQIDALVLDLAPDPADPATLTLKIAGDGFTTNDGGGEFKLARLEAALALTRTELLSAPDPAAAWRAEGGELKIAHFFAQNSQASLAIAGALHLDRENFLAGTLDTEVTNPAALVRAAGAAGLLNDQETEQAEAGLTLAAIAGGGKIAAPVILKDGVAEIAGVKIAPLPNFE